MSHFNSNLFDLKNFQPSSARPAPKSLSQTAALSLTSSSSSRLAQPLPPAWYRPSDSSDEDDSDDSISSSSSSSYDSDSDDDWNSPPAVVLDEDDQITAEARRRCKQNASQSVDSTVSTNTPPRTATSTTLYRNLSSDNMPDTLTQLGRGIFLWHIPQYYEKVSDPLRAVCDSPIFYTQLRHNYRVQFRTHLNGLGPFTNICNALFFRVLKGEHDLTNVWPFPYHMDVHLIDKQTLHQQSHLLTNSHYDNSSGTTLQTYPHTPFTTRPNEEQAKSREFVGLHHWQAISQVESSYIVRNALYIRIRFYNPIKKQHRKHRK